MKTRRILTLLLGFVLLLALLPGCSSGVDSNSRAEAEPAAPQATVAEDALYSAEEQTGAVLPQDRKLIKTVYLDAETEDMDALLTRLDAQVSELGGYMEARTVHNGSAYSSSRYRSADLTIRIPAENVDAFVKQVEDASNIISSNQTVEDVTLNYVATESRKLALETEQERLLELMESAETMADLLEIEARLTEVRYELESITSQLRLYDNQIDYATVYLSVSQVQELTAPEPESFWERISTGFVDSVKNLGSFFVELVIALIVGLPYILVVAVIAIVIILLCRRGKKRRNAKRQPPVNQ